MLTTRQISALKPGQWRSDGGPRGGGVLVFHASSAGHIWAYFRHTLPDGRRYDYPLGPYDEKGRQGSNLATLRERAGELSRLYRSGTKDLRAHFEAKAKAKAAALAEAEAEAARQREEQGGQTLARLMEIYIHHLEGQGKDATAKDVQYLLNTHLLKAAPELANLPAKDVSKSLLAARVREIYQAGKVRTAGKFRSYVSAAYNLAIRSEGDTQAPAALIRFGIENNPVAGIKAIPVAAKNRVLSLEELQTFIDLLGDSLPDLALRLCLFAGGQRGAQVLRAKVSDYDPATGILRLLDGKGGRQQPREHRLPIGPVATELVNHLVAQARAQRPDDGDPPLFAKRGKVLDFVMVTKRAHELAIAMGGTPFSFGDLRRSVETEMAAIGFSRDLRAQLLSHGLSGVQERHYDRHGYIEEKRAALIRWENHLTGKAADNVIAIRGRKKAVN